MCSSLSDCDDTLEDDPLERGKKVDYLDETQARKSCGSIGIAFEDITGYEELELSGLFTLLPLISFRIV